MNNTFVELTESDVLSVDGGGWLGVAGGVLIGVGVVATGGGALVVGCGIAGAAATIIECWP